ncbi:hypothetical protein B0T14DRAFT_582569 [Immersiella caudata]|uniref:Uncharacterized protein n=1 Tax=Immersiella caudata TaxID=314043 RepID=A0AA39WXZ7_9PEZI|nr:hypothetical protein B0T14DRAFT_582569 [Immersiella caudata]
MSDGKPYDGKNILQLALDGKSPFAGAWDVELLIREIEEQLNTKDFAREYLLERLFKAMPPSLSMPVAPTRDFWTHALEAKIEATIGEEGEMIGWESDNERVGPIALAAQQSLLQAIPCLLPVDDGTGGSLYRLVIEHGDFGIHNTTISIRAGSSEPLFTSLFNWETAMSVGPVDLVVDEDGGPSVTRLPEETTQVNLETYTGWANHRIQTLYHETPGYEAAVRAGKDFRKLWFTLRD